MKDLVQQAPAKPRPYWHVDAKWVSGIVFGVVLAVWLLLFAAYQITQRDTAVQLMTNLVTLGMKQGDAAANQQAIESFRQQIAASPTRSFEPLPGVTITEADLNLGADGLRDKIFKQVVEPIYDKGTRGAAEAQTADKAAQDEFVNSASALSVMTKQSHDAIGTWLVIIGVVTAAFGGLAIYFSDRFGRVVTPALILLFVALPGWILFLALGSFTNQPNQASGSVTDYFQLANMAKGAFVPAAVVGQQVYVIAVLTALTLLAAAIIGKIVYSIVKGQKQVAK